MLVATGIVKNFGPKRALRGVDVEVRPGAFSVVIGPSGSGKTTLVRALSLLDPPASGTVAIDGTRYNFPAERRENWRPWPKVTVVFQQQFLWPHLSLRQNILLPMRHNGKDDSALDSLLDDFGMHEFIDRFPNETSAGQRQRAALTRALALEPQYILLDEITSALDVEQTGVVIRYLLAARRRGIGVLIVTQLLEFAKQLASHAGDDMVYFLDEGEIQGRSAATFFAAPPSARAAAFIKAADYWGTEERS